MRECVNVLVKRLFIALFCLWTCVPVEAQYYDFTATAPTGQTLYFMILPDGVGVTHPGWDEHNPWQGYTKPSGTLEIPAQVRWGDSLYAVVELSSLCFLECNDLTALVLPPTLRRIERYAVAGCRGLRGALVVPGGVEVVGNYAFCCSWMDAVVLPPSLKKIGYSAFQDCQRLAFVEVPSSVVAIGKDAFLYVPSVRYHGAASGAPWGAAVLNGRATAASLGSFLPHATRHGGSGK